MLDLFNTPTPQTANYQEFYGGGTVRDWIKPRGASMVRFMLIGAGGGGSNGSATVGGGGGGSGAVTSWIGPAIFIPDVLRISIAAGGTSGVNAGVTSVIYQAKDGTGYTLLTANGGVSGTTVVTAGTGGTAMTSNQFCASGIFTSTVGQDGTAGGSTAGGNNRSASTTTFLSGGSGGSGSAAVAGSVTPNYGYTTLAAVSGVTKGRDGYFITEPILLGCGGAGGGTSTTAGLGGGRGGIGCGGGGSGEDGNDGGRGGDGAVFIWAW